MFDWIRRLFEPDDIEMWHAIHFMEGKIEGNIIHFSAGYKVPVEDWNPIKNPIQFLAIYIKARQSGFDLETDCTRTYLPVLRQWLFATSPPLSC